MSTLQPRPPYTESELRKLYPEQLELSLVQIILRHGERAPTSVRFQNTGLSQHWPYCSAADRLRSIILTDEDTPVWTTLQWQRKLETFGKSDDRSKNATGPSGEVDGICQPGELTDVGRRSTYQLGKRLRHLYVHQLGFMPELISNADMFYLRATEVLRAIESTQQTWLGMYPNNTRSLEFPPTTIFTRPLKEETLFPNDFHCQKFIHLFKAFGKHAANKWNDTKEMQYLNERLSKWMPPDFPNLAVDSQPSLHGMMDTIFATQAHGPETRLPEAFYDPVALKIIDEVACDEWYGGYAVSREFRTLGTGPFAGDIIDRMITRVDESSTTSDTSSQKQLQDERREPRQRIRFALYGCHDVTLAAFLASFGTFENPIWPHFTSHIAVELFRRKKSGQLQPEMKTTSDTATINISKDQLIQSGNPLESPSVAEQTSNTVNHESTDMLRRAWVEYSEPEKKRLNGYYVRLRYNDRILRVPGCAPPGRHLEGDESFCTLEAFKRVADGFIPKDWRGQCAQKLEEPVAGIEKGTEQKPGHIEEGF